MNKNDVPGEPLPLRKVQRKANRKSIKEIRGIAKAYAKAPKYVLKLEANHSVRVYVTVDGTLGTNRDEARRFRMGFDDEETRRKFWMGKLGVKLMVERV
jgi:hypothetical protein